MRIKTRFYYHNKGNYFVYGGWMVLKDRQIVHLDKLPLVEKARPFYYDDTFYTITYESKEKKRVLDANTIITEAVYRTSQLEYLVKLNWVQRQKLLWMFRSHWLQQPGNVIHIAILGIMVTLAFVGFDYMNHKF